jgi:predicted anti-sigma-YlaC factor YlaD
VKQNFTLIILIAQLMIIYAVVLISSLLNTSLQMLLRQWIEVDALSKR